MTGSGPHNRGVIRIAVLGSTGSIGTQTLDVVRRLPDQLQVVGLAAHRQGDLLLEQAREFGVSRVALFDEAAARRVDVPGGMNAVLDVACADDVDLVVVSVAGVIGLVPTLAAIEAGKRIALASKEVLVTAGEIVMPKVAAQGTMMTPIDSEHSAVFQCLQGYRVDQIDQIILTASGGPFRGRTRDELKSVTRADALDHPTWSMGGKITIDSATLMNKALETIEAKWLFGVNMDQVDVVVHPQSVLHSLVRFKDGSAIGQLGFPDMRLPIQYALLYPERIDSGLPTWDPVQTPQLSFEAVDHATFPAIQLAREVERRGGTAPCVMNAANEAAVAHFLAGSMGYLDIVETVTAVVEHHETETASLESLLEYDEWARREVASRLGHG